MSAAMSWSQFLRELHFIEASRGPSSTWTRTRRSFFGNCTSLRPVNAAVLGDPGFASQFLLELHLIEVPRHCQSGGVGRRRSSFWNCTSLRPAVNNLQTQSDLVAVPSGTALH